MQPVALQWFIRHIEVFAPAELRAERQQLYTSLEALHPTPGASLYDNLCLFVLAQIVAAHHLVTATPGGKAAGRSSAQETWYSKERQRIARLLHQIAESPVVSFFQSTITYYEAVEVTCQHGRNQKTCEELYALRLTLQLLERHQTLHGVRKQVELLRQREPHLPPLHELCAPPGQPHETSTETSMEGGVPDTTSLPTQPLDGATTYLLGTVVSRLRHIGLTVAQSCALVDQILHCCFDRPDPSGTRPALLEEQWRRLH